MSFCVCVSVSVCVYQATKASGCYVLKSRSRLNEVEAECGMISHFVSDEGRRRKCQHRSVTEGGAKRHPIVHLCHLAGC